MKAMTKIFTFWEPKEKMPGYIRLCLRTWMRFIPDAEVVLLDFSNVGDWLPAELVRRTTCRKLSLPKQADIYRAFLLEKHGGVWLDADTIVTPAFVSSGFWLESDAPEVLAFKQLHDGKTGDDFSVSLAFFAATRPQSKFMTAWCEEILRRADVFSRYAGNPLLRLFRRSQWRRCRKWDYFGNDIVDPLAVHLPRSEFRALDLDATGVFPECVGRFYRDNRAFYEGYCKYYFTPGDPQDALRASRGLVMLHNSWTPPAYRAMDEEDFLRSDVRLAGVFRCLLTDRS